MSDIVILSAVRTPIGNIQGSLSSLSAPKLGAIAIKGAVERAGVAPDAVEHVIMGNVLQAGVGQAPARQASRGAGIPDKAGAITVNKVCGSGMRAVMDAANMIKAGEFEVIVAGGMESMSSAPHMMHGRNGVKMGDITMVDSMLYDGLRDPDDGKAMGTCGELVADKYKFTREMQDAYALESFNKAKAAIDGGKSAQEIVAVEITDKKGNVTRVEKDENPHSAPLAKMPTLKPAFDKNGTITAANAPGVNDGAAALVITSAEKAKALGKKPIARIVAQGTFSQEPKWFTTAPSHAAKQALKRANLTQNDIGLWEVNEAFSVVAMAFIRDMEIDASKVNVRGGAVAYGHPIGASGARIITTLLHEMIATKTKYGCAAICLGGGEGTAVIIENLSA